MASKGAIKAGEGWVSLNVDASALEKGLKAAADKCKAFGASIAGVGASVAAAGATITAPFLYGLKTFSEMGSEIAKTSRITGMSFHEVQEMMDGTRMSADDLGTATKKMSTFLSDAAHGSPEAIRLLDEMGISLDELTSMSQADRMKRFADGLQNIGDVAQRNAAQVKLFGKNGLEANFAGGSAGMRERTERAQRFMPNLNDSDVQLGADFTRAQKEMGEAVKSIWVQLGAAAAPTMLWFVRVITEIVIAVRQWMEANRPLLATIFSIGEKLALVGTGIGIVGGAFVALALSMPFLASMISVATTAIVVMKTVLYAEILPIIIGIGAAIVVASAFVGSFIYIMMQFETTWDILRGIGDYLGETWIPIFKNLGQIIGTTFGAVSDLISLGEFKAAFEVIWISIKLITEQGINWIKDSWYAFKFMFLNVGHEIATAIGKIFNDISASINRTITKVTQDALVMWTEAQEKIGLKSKDDVTSARLERTRLLGDTDSGGMSIGEIERNRRARERELNNPANAPVLQRADRTVERGLAADLERISVDANFNNQMATVLRQYEAEFGREGQLKRDAKETSFGTFSADALRGGIGSNTPIEMIQRDTATGLQVQRDILARLQGMEGLVAE